MRRVLLTLLCGALTGSGATLAHAEVRASTANSFSLQQALGVNAPVDALWRSLLLPQTWWSSAHTFSGDAANLSLEPRAGGCWCERLADGGSVQHLRVVNLTPRQTLVLEGALGPLQSLGVSGAMTLSVTAQEGGRSALVLTYNVGGAPLGGTPLGDAAALAQAVDGVLAQQLARLKQRVESTRDTTTR